MADTMDVGMLQSEYLVEMEKAKTDRQVNGDYTKAGLLHMVKAAEIQYRLSKQTSGEKAQQHKAVCDMLVRDTMQHMRRLGLVKQEETPAPAPAAQPAPQSVEPVQPAQPSSQPAAKKGGKEKSANSELEGFNVEDYIVKPGRVSLESARDSFPEVVDALKSAIDSDISRLFPNVNVAFLKRNDNCMFYGPPGTGKSHICSGLATYLDEVYPDGRSAFFLIDSTIASKYVGTAENRIKAIFEAADQYEYAIICVDEAEKICPPRGGDSSKSNYTSTFLERIEGVGEGTKAMVIIATNHPDKVDSALLSRLGRQFFIDYARKPAYVSFLRKRTDIADALGENEEQREKMIDMLADIAIERKFSFRPMQTVCTDIFDTMVRKTRKAYPDGSAELQHLLSLTEEELREIIDRTNSDFNAAEYQKLLEYDQNH